MCFWAQMFSIPNTKATYLWFKGAGRMKSNMTRNPSRKEFFLYFVQWRLSWVVTRSMTHSAWSFEGTQIWNCWTSGKVVQTFHYKQATVTGDWQVARISLTEKRTSREILWTTGSQVWGWLPFLAKSQSAIKNEIMEHRCSLDLLGNSQHGGL